tara:strand:+ start:593 stop:781 length:189 start_codon:yes stop_codon:yes gene_type:complete
MPTTFNPMKLAMSTGLKTVDVINAVIIDGFSSRLDADERIRQMGCIKTHLDKKKTCKVIVIG